MFVIPRLGGGKIKRKRKENDRKVFDFIGSSRSDNMTGLFNRQEITYGKKKITKINKSDKKHIKKLNKKSHKTKSIWDIKLDF